MSWQQIIIEAGQYNPELLAAFFEQQGALSVTLADAADQPLYEPDPGTTPLWQATRVTALFSDDVDVGRVERALAEKFDAQLLDHVQRSLLQDQDWERLWLDRFQPMRFGERLWVCPAGQRPADTAGQVLVDLDPGLAFGTGTHPTTALCLADLDRHPPSGQRVLDYGCGSGILAIAALKLGAAQARAVDIDPQALVSAGENARRNQVSERLTITLPEELRQAEPFDLLLANILANPLIGLAQKLAGLIAPGGRLVLSGILQAQADEVRAAYAAWFHFTAEYVKEDWVCLAAERKLDVK